MKKSALLAGALMFASLPALSQEAPRSGESKSPSVERGAEPGQRGGLADGDFRDRMADAIAMVEDACAADIDFFCGKVTPGEGRLALCMRAHEDQLSRGCRFGVYRVARNIGQFAQRTAEACWQEVRALCGDADRIGPCVAQKKGSLSPSCADITTMLGQRVEELTARVGMPVYSPDGKVLGQVAEVSKGTDGKVQSIQVDIGRVLGLGTKVVAIGADKIEPLAGIKVRLSEAELRAMPEANKP
jgi:Golgi apparatus protein 1